MYNDKQLLIFFTADTNPDVQAMDVSYDDDYNKITTIASKSLETKHRSNQYK